MAGPTYIKLRSDTNSYSFRWVVPADIRHLIGGRREVTKALHTQDKRLALRLRKLPDCAIDGELVMLDDKGKPEFHQLRGRCAIRDPERVGRAAARKPAAVFAFDLLSLRGKDLRSLPLLKRKAALQKELRRTDRIVYCQHVGESAEKLFMAAEQLGLEGVIGKKANSLYQRGRTTSWVKVKTVHGRHIDEERAKWNE